MLRIVVPTSHSRESRSPLFRNHLKCGEAARGVDFKVVRNLLKGVPDEGDDELPLDILQETQGLVA